MSEPGRGCPDTAARTRGRLSVPAEDKPPGSLEFGSWTRPAGHHARSGRRIAPGLTPGPPRRQISGRATARPRFDPPGRPRQMSEHGEKGQMSSRHVELLRPVGCTGKSGHFGRNPFGWWACPLVGRVPAGRLRVRTASHRSSDCVTVALYRRCARLKRRRRAGRPLEGSARRTRRRRLSISPAAYRGRGRRWAADVVGHLPLTATASMVRKRPRWSVVPARRGGARRLRTGGLGADVSGLPIWRMCRLPRGFVQPGPVSAAWAAQWGPCERDDPPRQ